MVDFKIEKGVPIPDVRCSGLSEFLRKLEIGDSVLFPRSFQSKVAVTGKNIGIKVATRKEDKDTVRVWRVA